MINDILTENKYDFINNKYGSNIDGGIATTLIHGSTMLGKAKKKLAVLEIDERSATTIMLVSGGYPENYEKGKIISGLETIEDSIVFHAGTKLDNGNVVSNGGRVLTVTSYGNDFQEAIKKSYQNIAKLNFDKMYFRKDIGNDLK